MEVEMTNKMNDKERIRLKRLAKKSLEATLKAVEKGIKDAYEEVSGEKWDAEEQSPATERN